MKVTRSVSSAVVVLSVLLAGCGGGGAGSGGAQGGRPSPAASTYPVRGVLKAVAPDRTSVTIDHEEIPDFMDAMEMDFSVPDPAVVQGIEPGSYVEGDLRVQGRLMEITRLAKAEGGPSPSPAAGGPSPAVSPVSSPARPSSPR